MSKFPEYKGAQFSVADVEDYLTILAEKGWKVSSRRNGTGYVIDLDDDKRINIYYSTKTNECSGSVAKSKNSRKAGYC
jgi:hypothetical protein